MAKANSGIPQNVMDLLASADKRNNLPAGTMLSIMQQEVGGNIGKYLDDPSIYHYGLNAEGKRIAGHTGKVSTAFGPFGILESTAAQPGYGVKPLQNKSLEEQIRFASDYAAARSKGNLAAGLAAYGEGDGYAKQVMARIPQNGNAPVVSVPSMPPMQVATVAQDAPVPTPVGSPVPVQQMAQNDWGALPQAMDRIAPQDLNFAVKPVDLSGFNIPAPKNRQINLTALAALSGLKGVG